VRRHQTLPAKDDELGSGTAHKLPNYPATAIVPGSRGACVCVKLTVCRARSRLEAGYWSHTEGESRCPFQVS
jgi:hypothetical protein